MRKILSTVMLAACVLGAPYPAVAQVRIAAAASLSNVVDALAAVWKDSGGGAIVASYGASSALARQIENGAPVDLFISADLEWMDYLQDKRLIDLASRRIVAANSLVLIAPADSKLVFTLAPGADLSAALGNSRLALAEPASVPAGKYAKGALIKLGLWTGIEGKLAAAENVRGALALVARGEAPLGIVYSTDAAAEPRVKILDTFPADSHPAIVYPAALTLAGKDNAQARAWLEFLLSEKARVVWARFGFAPPPS
jgi:molybdate transport system substrate-binding protein